MNVKMPTFLSTSVEFPVNSLLDGWVCFTEPLVFPVKNGTSGEFSSS